MATVATFQLVQREPPFNGDRGARAPRSTGTKISATSRTTTSRHRATEEASGRHPPDCRRRRARVLGRARCRWLAARRPACSRAAVSRLSLRLWPRPAPTSLPLAERALLRQRYVRPQTPLFTSLHPATVLTLQCFVSVCLYRSWDLREFVRVLPVDIAPIHRFAGPPVAKNQRATPKENQSSVKRKMAPIKLPSKGTNMDISETLPTYNKPAIFLTITCNPNWHGI